MKTLAILASAALIATTTFVPVVVAAPVEIAQQKNLVNRYAILKTSVSNGSRTVRSGATVLIVSRSGDTYYFMQGGYSFSVNRNGFDWHSCNCGSF